MRTNAVISGFVLSGILHAGLVYVFSVSDLGSASPHKSLDAWEGSIVPLALAAPEIEPPPPVLPPLSPPQIPEPPPPKPPPTSQPRLGIDDAKMESDNWQGFKESSSHSGPLSTTDQSALAPEPGTEGKPSVASPGAPDSKPREASPPAEIPDAMPTPPDEQPEALEPVARPATEQPPAPPTVVPPVESVKRLEVEPQPPVEPDLVNVDVPEATSEMPQEPPRPGDEERIKAPEEVRKAEENVAEVEAEVKSAEDGTTEAPVIERGDAVETLEAVEAIQKPSLVPKPRPFEPPPIPAEVPALAHLADPEAVSQRPWPASIAAPPSRASTGGSGVGLTSDRESDASSREPDYSVSPGKVLAGVGIQVRTVRPRWSTTTRLTATPKNPVVEILFTRDGKVAKAKFVEGRTTGHREVDGPLLDSVYRWTATGKKLEEAVGEDGTVSFVIRMILTDKRESELMPMDDIGE